MTGHHEVRRWELPYWEGQIMTLPPGWKPFAVIKSPKGEGYEVVCRKWVRDEKTKAKEPSA
jgi:hypothetical protein